MHVQTLPLLPAAPGQALHLQVLHFGTPGAGPKVTIQAALHADEVPALLVAQQLRTQLAALESRGDLLGHVQLVPYANPIGLAQQVLGRQEGRFDLRDGVNFNREHPLLADAVAARLEGQLGVDEAANTRAIRAALMSAAQALPARHPAEDLKRRLLQTAIDSDFVIDLHCDSQAVMHLYALTQQADWAEELGALLGAQAVLLAEDSGGGPFDEACSRPWLLLRERFAPLPVALACFCTTVELRGRADTDHALARQDAQALIDFLRRRGVVAGAARALPAALCPATPLAASEPIVAPSAGVVVFRHAPGERVEAGAVIADLVDPASGETRALTCTSAGVLYARIASRWAAPGQRLAKVAGTTLARSGKLLSD